MNLGRRPESTSERTQYSLSNTKAIYAGSAMSSGHGGKPTDWIDSFHRQAAFGVIRISLNPLETRLRQRRSHGPRWDITYWYKLPSQGLWRRNESVRRTKFKSSTAKLDTCKDSMILEKAERRGEWLKRMPLSRNLYPNMPLGFGSDRQRDDLPLPNLDCHSRRIGNEE